ncbi:helix-turn-helix domain-containing protein [Thalassospira sp.]|uniref:helix-turn-helix domain-containing protein n=1 Tax=Thalassospira sp. TaxID=1912094 RepID=UPI0025F8EE21|nr:helix-turn-helix domain-containing protein [Thalassospira sp.]
MNHIASNSTKPNGSVFARPPRGPRRDRRAIRIETLKKRSFDTARLFCAGGWILAGPKDVIPVAPLEAVLLITLAGHRLATDEILMEALWPHPDDMPDYWADQIKVRVCKLKKQLKQVGATEQIVNEFGRGYWLRRTAI